MFEEKFFLRRKQNHERLLQYGFAREADGYRYVTSVLNGQFLLSVFVREDGGVFTDLTDCQTDEPYTLYKVPSAVGSYVGAVRSACEAVLTDISEKCFESDVFHGEQTRAVIEYVRTAYGDELEFLWEKFPDNAIFRRKDNQKWYAAILTVSKRKLGLDSDEIAEIIDLRLQPEKMAETVDGKTYFPGWHMNKKSWYTVILDGSVPTKELCQRLDESYHLAIK